jgi:hypothetical protein
MAARLLEIPGLLNSPKYPTLPGVGVISSIFETFHNLEVQLSPGGQDVRARLELRMKGGNRRMERDRRRWRLTKNGESEGLGRDSVFGADLPLRRLGDHKPDERMSNLLVINSLFLSRTQLVSHNSASMSIPSPPARFSDQWPKGAGSHARAVVALLAKCFLRGRMGNARFASGLV